MRENKDITILIVDDEPALRKAIAFDFRRKGYQVLEAENGKLAFEVVTHQKVDLVVSDVRMPAGDGIELLDRVKALNSEAPIVIFITGYADISLAEAYNKGADAVFLKPFDRKELTAAVARALLPREQAWCATKHETAEIGFRVNLKFTEFSQALKDCSLGVGRGGIFVALKDSLPEVGAKTAFRIEFECDAPGIINGEGIVRWVRIQSKVRSNACGLEIEHLDETCRSQVVEFIRRLKATAFIPEI